MRRNGQSLWLEARNQPVYRIFPREGALERPGSTLYSCHTDSASVWMAVSMLLCLMEKLVFFLRPGCSERKREREIKEKKRESDYGRVSRTLGVSFCQLLSNNFSTNSPVKSL